MVQDAPFENQAAAFPGSYVTRSGVINNSRKLIIMEVIKRSDLYQQSQDIFTIFSTK